MDTSEHVHPFPASMPPSEAPAPAPPGGPDQPRWPASVGLLGLLVALLGTFVLSGVLAVAYLVLGVDDPGNTDSFEFVALAAQSAAFVVTALLMTGRFGPPSAQQFGFRPFKRSAVGWALVALAAYFVLSAIYISITQPPSDNLPQQLGADKSTTLAIMTGIFVIGIAPPVEELFFRGFLYQSLRTRMGPLGGAILSGLIFGAVHLKLDYLVPLAILGTLLCFLFQKTGSLWPCILVHALNNAIAFSVTT
jgi:membrane protease YdiL (CAAX protease family)